MEDSKTKKNVQKFVPSSSVDIYFKDPTPFEIEGSFNIGSGRPPCVFQHNKQGKHVTSYHLVEHGLQRILDKFSYEEARSLKLIHRNLLRERRVKLYNYISAIAILDLERKDALFKYFDKQLETYNKIRIKKTEIKEKIHAKKIAELPGDYKVNREQLQNVFKQMSVAILSFYNQIKEVSFLSTNESTSSITDKDTQIIKSTLSRFDNTDLPIFIEWISDEHNYVIDSPIVTVKCAPIVKAMLALIDYRKIEIQELEKHQKEFLSSKNIKKKLKKISIPRNNDEETLIRMLVRHIHIFFAVYHELQKYLLEEITNIDQGKCKTDIIRNFIEQFLITQWGLKNPDDLQAKQEDIVVKVKQSLNDHQALTKEKGYIQYLSEKEDLCSSGDESIVIPEEEEITIRFFSVKLEEFKSKLTVETKDDKTILTYETGLFDVFERENPKIKCNIQ